MYEVNLLSSYLPVRSEMMYEVNLLSSYLPVRSENYSYINHGRLSRN